MISETADGVIAESSIKRTLRGRHDLFPKAQANSTKRRCSFVAINGPMSRPFCCIPQSPWDRLKIGGQAAIAIDGDDSLVGWNVCP